MPGPGISLASHSSEVESDVGGREARYDGRCNERDTSEEGAEGDHFVQRKACEV
jgi:hypothetical protein